MVLCRTICVLVVLLATHRGVADEAARPPERMDPKLAAAIVRLPLGCNRILVSQGTRPVPARVKNATDLRLELAAASRERARALSGAIYDDTMGVLLKMNHEHLHLLDGHKIKLCLESMPAFEVPLGFRDRTFETISVFVFEKNDHDPAKALSAALEASPHVKVQTIEGTRIAKRMIRHQHTSQPTNCWSPRGFVLVIVRGEKLLQESVKRWNDVDPTNGTLPWTLPAWGFYDASAATWGLRKATDREFERINFSAFMLTIEPRLGPETMNVTWFGDGKKDLGAVRENDNVTPFPGPAYFAPTPTELLRIDARQSRVSINKPLDSTNLDLPTMHGLISEIFGSVFSVVG